MKHNDNSENTSKENTNSISNEKGTFANAVLAPA